MKKQAISALFLLVTVNSCHGMTVLSRTGPAGQRTSNVLGTRSYGWGQSRAQEQAVQAAKMQRATEAITTQNRQLDEYFNSKSHLVNSDVLNRKSSLSNISDPQAVSLAEKTNLSWFDRIKSALYSIFASGSSRKVEQAIQEDNAQRFNVWWEEQKKE